MPKALYRAVWVIKNVYYDGAERLTERVLLFTSYCFKLIPSAQLLDDLSRKAPPPPAPSSRVFTDERESPALYRLHRIYYRAPPYLLLAP